MNAVEKLPAVSHLFFLVPTGKQAIVANSDKTFREYMHQKHSQKLCSFDGLLDIFTTIFVILYIFREALTQTRASLSSTARDHLYNTTMNNLKLVLNNNGTFSIEIAK